MKTILVPTDFSKCANNALDYAIAFAKKEKAELMLLHAFRVSYPVSDIPVAMIVEARSTTQRNAEKKLKELCRKIAQKQKVKCEYLCKEGFVVDVILELSKKIRPDFIMMGTKGVTGLKEVIFGSNTASVLEKARRPVIAVPEGSKFKGIKNITYATNYCVSELYALKKLSEIARPFKADIHILHIAEGEFTPGTEDQILKRFVSRVSKRFNYKAFSYQLIFGKNVERELNNYLKKESTDLLAMSTQHRNLWEKWFGKSITKNMAYSVNVPLLAFHHKKESILFI